MYISHIYSVKKSNEGYGDIKVPEDEYPSPVDDWQPPSITEQALMKPKPRITEKPYNLLTGISYFSFTAKHFIFCDK